MLLALALAADVAGMHPEAVFRAATVSAFLDYQHCLETQSTVAGAFTAADAQEVVRTIEPKCESRWQVFSDAMLQDVSPSRDDLALLDKYRRLAAGEAASSLVEARRGSCGTAAGPYACKP